MADEENSLSRDERRFAEQVRILREERGWTQEELAKRLKASPHFLGYMNQATISRIEKATRPVRMMEAQALARIFERTTTSMIHPDSKEIFLPVLSNSHTAARKAYAEFKAATRAMALAQNSAEKDLATLDQLFGDGSELHEDSRPILTHLRRSLHQFIAIPALAESEAIFKGTRSDDGQHQEEA